MSRLSDHHFTASAPVFGQDDEYDPFFDCADLTFGESEHRLSGEWHANARVGHAAGSRSSDGSDTNERKL